MQNYVNYFTEIEEHFQQRRGSLLLLSTLDWALIESWREAAVPLAAVLRGIDDAFDRHAARKNRAGTRRVNGLAWCAQAVMEAAQQMQEATTGMHAEEAEARETGFEREAVERHLLHCAEQMEQARAALPVAAQPLCDATTQRLRELTAHSCGTAEELEQTLRALEERLLAMLLATLPEQELTALRHAAAHAVAPYRQRMQAAQIRQVETQFVEKRLLEQYRVPRLSLFYMRGAA